MWLGESTVMWGLPAAAGVVSQGVWASMKIILLSGCNFIKIFQLIKSSSEYATLDTDTVYILEMVAK